MEESQLKAQALDFIIRMCEQVVLSHEDNGLCMDSLENMLSGAQQIYEFLAGTTK